MTQPFPSIAIYCNCPARINDAERLAAQLTLPLHSERQSEVDFYLVLTESHLALEKTGANAPGAVWVDFVHGANAYRRRQGGGRRQALARAVGIKQKPYPFVLDATAGLGRDAFVLAGLGCSVLMIERHPVIAALLAEGLQRAADDTELTEIVARMHYRVADAVSALSSWEGESRPDVVYLDPMYPTHHKAQVKKDMQLLRELVGMDFDADALLLPALACAQKRVVVKRVSTAPPLANKEPNVTLKLKRHRFDIYFPAA